jgi:EAL and modified HD-GYP domain-containing signal transduction protein
MQLGDLIVNIKNHGDFQLLANPVESEELYTVCHKLGFNLFQGYFFAKALPARAKAVDSQRLHVMQLLNQTIKHADISELEKGFKHDPVLSYKLLRFINSPATGLMQPVRSIAHALVVLGYDQLYRWLTLLLFASGQPDQRTLALMNNALVRARLTELLGRKKLKPQEQEGLFITGIFSLLDALLSMSMETALEKRLCSSTKASMRPSSISPSPAKKQRNKSLPSTRQPAAFPQLRSTSPTCKP